MSQKTISGILYAVWLLMPVIAFVVFKLVRASRSLQIKATLAAGIFALPAYIGLICLISGLAWPPDIFFRQSNSSDSVSVSNYRIVYAQHVVGTVIESFSSDASPSAQQMAALVDQIKIYEAPAIFLDASDNPALAQQIAAETGVKAITDLHLESLTEGAPATTYIEMMKYNVTQIVEAIQ